MTTAMKNKASSNHLAGDPIPELTKPTGSIGICAQGLAEILRNTYWCCDPESTRYALGSVLVEFASQETVAIGTDGRRMSTSRTCDVGGSTRTIIAVDGHAAGESVTLMIPKSVARTIANRVTTKATGNATVMFFEGRFVRISWRDRNQERYVTFQTDEGRFPRWQDVMMDQPESATTVVKGKAGELTEALSAILDPDPAFDWNLSSESSEFTRSKSSQIDKGWKVVKGPDLNVCLNISYLYDFVRTVHEDATVTLYMKDASSAVEMHCAIEDRVYVVMPLAK